MPFITQGKANIKYILIVFLVAAVSGGIIFIIWNNYQKEMVNLNNFTEIKNSGKNVENGVVCTAEAKICPDGSSVGRIGPNCEFAACPTDETTDWNLENAEYYTITYEETVKLENGHYFKEFPGLAEGLDVSIYKNKIALGDLNNDNEKDAAVILDVTEGGSGDFRELAIMLNENNEPAYFTSISLGDRTIINSIDIQLGIITLNMVVQGPNDGMCCPTLNKIFKYKLSENKLVEI
jgi:hypothetical protein